VRPTTFQRKLLFVYTVGEFDAGEAPFGHHRYQVAVTKPVSDVPANAKLNGFGLEPAAAIKRVALD
jgi:hypothetical protein